MSIFNAVIGALRVNLGLDSAEFENGVKRNREGLKSLFLGFTVDLGDIAEKIGEAIKEIPEAINGVIERADDLGHLSQKIGVPVEALSQLQFAAQATEVSFALITASLRRLSQDMVGGAKGTSTAATALKDLGVSTRDAAGAFRPTQAVFLDVAQKLSSLRDGAGKTALELAIFGKSGAELAPLLNRGREGIEALMHQSDLLGLTLSGEAAEQADAFKTNMGLVSASVQGVVTRLAEALLPVLDSVSAAMSRAAQWGAALAGNLGGLVPYIEGAAAALAGLVAPSIIVGLADLVRLIAVGMVGAIRSVTVALLANPLGLIVAGVALAIAAAIHFRDQIKKAIGIDVVSVLKTVANVTIASFISLVEDVGDLFGHLGPIIGDAIISAGNMMVSGINSMLNSAIDGFNNLIDTLDVGLALIHQHIDHLSKDILNIPPIPNPYSGGIGDFLGRSKDRQVANLGTDYVGLGMSLVNVGTSAEKSGEQLNGWNGTLAKVGKTVKTVSDTIADSLSTAFQSGFSTLQDELKQGVSAFVAFGDAVKQTISSFIDQVASSAFKNAANELANLLVPNGNSGSSDSGPSLIGAIGSALSGMLHFADGGSGVVGGAGGRDSQLFTAMVTPGEPYAFGDDAIDGIGGGGFAFSPTTYLTVGAGVNRAEIQAALDQRDKRLYQQFGAIIADKRRRGQLA